MSSRNIIKADMHKLMPSYSEALPTDLIALAETYVTQTQNLHFTASDTPARLFLCSHLACDRSVVDLMCLQLLMLEDYQLNTACQI